MLRLSICIIAYNEEEFLPSLLEDMRRQRYPHEYTEIVLIDGMSSDGTREIMERFAEEDNRFYSVKVLDNPKRIQAAGWNVAISNATGDVIARIDAHTKIPAEYSENVMKNIADGEAVVGGVRPCVIEKDTLWGDALLKTENSLFGSSINKSRHSLEKTYVKTMFHAAYRREVFEKVGGFNEELLRTEDNEMHYRIRRAGYKLCYDPEIVSYQYARSSFGRMIKQKFGNGKWIGITLRECPGCISPYHLVPFLFVGAILCTSLLAGFGIWMLSALMWGLYGAFALVNTVITAVSAKRFNPFYLLMPFFFLTLHVAYGVGTCLGIVRALLASKKKA